MSPTIVELNTTWCDCDRLLIREIVSIGVPGSLPTFHQNPACGGWYEHTATSVAQRIRPNTQRPKDRVGIPVLSPLASRALNFNIQSATPMRLGAPVGAGAMSTMPPEDGREYDGFCNACGGLRKHRLRCPKVRS